MPSRPWKPAEFPRGRLLPWAILGGMDSSQASLPRIYSPTTGGLLLEFQGKWYDLSAWAQEADLPGDLLGLITSGALTPDRLRPLLPDQSPDLWSEVAAPELKNWLPPIPHAQVGKVLCLGKNFAAHAAEFGEAVPTELLWFSKFPSTIIGHGNEVRVRPWYTDRVDHEAELALVMARTATDLTMDNALETVGGWTVANDLTARTLQGKDRKKGHPWMRAKNMDGFLPMGPCLIPAGFIDPHTLQVTCRVGEDLRQNANTRDLVVRVEQALVTLSSHVTLDPGDIVLMGTPEGVGPLQDLDSVTCEIESIGALTTTILRPAQ